MMKPPVLLVCARGGPPMSDVLPHVATVAEPHLLLLAKPSSAATASITAMNMPVIDATDECLTGEQLAERISHAAKTVKARGILTFSEFALIAVAMAADQLSLPGPGPGVLNARNKQRMRQTWKVAGVPIPRFHPVESIADLRQAWYELQPPLLLKTAWGAGSIGQVVVHRREELPASMSRARAAARQAERIAMAEMYVVPADDLIAEEIIRSGRESWDDNPHYADYLSVEGVVVEGNYHPVCITERLPILHPFVERGNLAPSVLPEPQQRKIEQAARLAVAALGLHTCGTHTELKLLPNQQVCLLESAARFGGHLLTRQIAAIYGINLVAALTAATTGQDPELPRQMITSPGRCAAGSVNMIAADARGMPWLSAPLFYPDRINLNSLVSTNTHIEVVPDFTAVKPGHRMQAFKPSQGSLNLAGVLYLQAPNPQILTHDAVSVLNGLEQAMVESATQE